MPEIYPLACRYGSLRENILYFFDEFLFLLLDVDDL